MIDLIRRVRYNYLTDGTRENEELHITALSNTAALHSGMREYENQR